MHDELIQKIKLLRSWYVFQEADANTKGTEHPWFALPWKELTQLESENVRLVCDELLKRLEGEQVKSS